MEKQRIKTEIENEKDIDAIEAQRVNLEQQWMEEYYYYEELEQQEWFDVDPIIY